MGVCFFIKNELKLQEGRQDEAVADELAKSLVSLDCKVKVSGNLKKKQTQNIDCYVASKGLKSNISYYTEKYGCLLISLSSNFRELEEVH